MNIIPFMSMYFRLTPLTLFVNIQAQLFSAMQNRILELRIERQWRQADVGEKAEVAPSRISLYERGKLMPTALVQERIAKAFGVKREDIFLPADVHKKGK